MDATALCAVERWRERPEHRALHALFDDDTMPRDEIVPRATALLADPSWVEPLLEPLIAAAIRDPRFAPPIESSRDSLRTGAVLIDGAAGSLVAAVLSADGLAAQAPPASVVASGRISITRYARAGGATLRRWRVAPMTPDFSMAQAPAATELPPRALFDGAVIASDGRVEAALATGATRDIVTLTAHIRADAEPLMREYRVADGALLRVAAADDRASRCEMLLAFLRLSGRADAGGCFEAFTRDPAFHLRWAAMREWLALDLRSAFPRLAEMALADPHPEIRLAAARTLRLAEARLGRRAA